VSLGGAGRGPPARQPAGAFTPALKASATVDDRRIGGRAGAAQACGRRRHAALLQAMV
jgi:hypothetical protein